MSKVYQVEVTVTKTVAVYETTEFARRIDVTDAALRAAERVEGEVTEVAIVESADRDSDYADELVSECDTSEHAFDV